MGKREDTWESEKEANVLPNLDEFEDTCNLEITILLIVASESCSTLMSLRMVSAWRITVCSIIAPFIISRVAVCSIVVPSCQPSEGMMSKNPRIILTATTTSASYSRQWG